MQAPTHLAFAMLSSAAAGAVVGRPLTPAEFLWAAVGALLPDIDTPTSLIGKVCPPLSQALERQWGHREVTHSLAAALMLALAMMPLGWWIGYPGWAIALVVGYGSHLLLDAATKSGVPLFYPSTMRAVIPGKESLRIASGSRQERLLCVAMVVVFVALLPLNTLGMRTCLHRIIQTTAAAVSDYRAWGGECRVFAQVEGRFQVSQRQVSGVFEVLGIANANLLVVLDRQTGRVYSIGTHKDASIYPNRVYCFKGEPIATRVQEVVVDNELLTDAVAHLPGGETFIEGEIKTLDQVVVSQPPDVWTTVEPGVKTIRLRYARPEDLRKPEMEGVFALGGHLYVRTVRPLRNEVAADSQFSASAVAVVETERAQPTFAGVVDIHITHVRDLEREVLVRRGDTVLKGQVIAALTYHDQERKRQENALADEIALSEAHIAALVEAGGREGAQAHLEVTKAMGEVGTVRREWTAAMRLYRLGALSPAHVTDERHRLTVAAVHARVAWLSARTVAHKRKHALLQARAAVAQARRKREALQEAWEATRVRAPADGKVLLVRPHIVNDQNMTALIRLLIKRVREQPGPAAAIKPLHTKNYPCKNPPSVG